MVSELSEPKPEWDVQSETSLIKRDESGRNRDERGHYLPGHAIAGPGRPKLEYSLTEMLRNKIAEKSDIVDRWIALMESDDERVALSAIMAAANRIEGMPRQSVETHGTLDVDVGLAWEQ